MIIERHTKTGIKNHLMMTPFPLLVRTLVHVPHDDLDEIVWFKSSLTYLWEPRVSPRVELIRSVSRSSTGREYRIITAAGPRRGQYDTGDLRLLTVVDIVPPSSDRQARFARIAGWYRFVREHRVTRRSNVVNIKMDVRDYSSSLGHSWTLTSISIYTLVFIFFSSLSPLSQLS